MLLAPIFFIIQSVLTLYWWVVLIRVILSLLFQFEIVPYRNPAARSLDDFCRALTEPVMRLFPPAIRYVQQFDLGPLFLMILVVAAQIFFSNLQVSLGA